MSTAKTKVAQIAVDDFLDKIAQAAERGEILTWMKGWISGSMVNAETGVGYTGFNRVRLALAGALGGFEHDAWLTAGQIKKLGGHIDVPFEEGVILLRPLMGRKRNHPDPGQDDDDEYVVSWAYFRAFNVDSVSNLDRARLILGTLERPLTEFLAEGDAEAQFSQVRAFVSRYAERKGLKPLHEGDKAEYHTAADRPRCPAPTFQHPSRYFAASRRPIRPLAELVATLAHELIHSTCHASRLRRVDTAKSDPEWRNKEEIIAETGSRTPFGYEAERPEGAGLRVRQGGA